MGYLTLIHVTMLTGIIAVIDMLHPSLEIADTGIVSRIIMLENYIDFTGCIPHLSEGDLALNEVKISPPGDLSKKLIRLLNIPIWWFNTQGRG